MIEEPPSAGPPGLPPGRLDSWKDIASYLKRDVSTVQRWEKREGMPVHRHLHDKLGSVYAFPAELDVWWRSRQIRLAGARAATTPAVETATAQPTTGTPSRTPRRHRMWWAAAAIAVVLASLGGILQRPDDLPDHPLSDARFVRLTEFEGAEHSAAISRDGRFVAFLADRDGPADVWLTQVGTGQFHNLTGGSMRELVNPDIRTIGFSPDGTLVLHWMRRQSASRPSEIGVWAIPTLGGKPTRYLEGGAEFDWSSDGTRLVYHTPAPGDPMFVSDQSRREKRQVFAAAPGLHNHFPAWSPDDSFLYFVHGTAPDQMDLWRIKPAGGAPERITSHNSRVSHPTFLNRRTLLYLAPAADGSGPWLHSVDVERPHPRRISLGVERYTSLAASADGRRLVATVANPKRTLWRVPIADRVVEESAATRVAVPAIRARAPRIAPDHLLYVSSRGDDEGIWKLAGGTATELWSAAGSRVIGGPAISPDGQRIAFSAEQDGRTRLVFMNADGSSVRVLPESLQPHGTPAWAPDGRSLAVAATIDGAPGLARVSADGASFSTLMAEFAADPTWSPDGALLVYSGPDVGTTFPIRMVSADGRRQPLPDIALSRGARRLAFLPGTRTLIVLRGEMNHMNFWALDLASGRERQLTNFRAFVVDDFDVSADGREIVFDREQDHSDIVLIDRSN